MAETAQHDKPSVEDRRRYAAWLGSHTSEKKAAAARENGTKGEHPGRPLLSLDQIPCTCGRVATTPEGHMAKCSIRRAIARRQKQGAVSQVEEEGL